MDINELTVGQAKELAGLFGGIAVRGGYLAGHVGKYVLVRSRNEGVNAGYVVSADETGIVLRECRRLWFHRPKDSAQAWYEGVAKSGVSRDSKVSAKVTKVIMEDYSITLCTDTARESIEGAPDHVSS